jgi:hypothetical protein
MRIEFTEEGHSYLVNGEAYPSVTQILSAEGLTDFSFCTEGHRDRGNRVHQICDLIDQGGWHGQTAEEIIANSAWDPEATSPLLIPYGYAYCAYLLRAQPNWKLREEPVASKVYRFAGRLDRFGVADGKNVLADIKSGDPGDAASIQEALYGLALEETHGLKADERVAIWLRPNGTFKCVPGNGIDVRIGIAAVQLYHYRKARGLYT